MTLAKTWQNCLRMWRWVVEEWKKDNDIDVDELKEMWLEENDSDTSLKADCYFCERAGTSCDKCPGKLVSKSFDCQYKKYHYLWHPDKFLKKLEQLNKKRLSK